MSDSMRYWAALAVGLGLSACGDSTGPSTVPFKVSFVVTGSTGTLSPALMSRAFSDVTITEGTKTLVIQTAQLVLGEVELRRDGSVLDCDLPEGEAQCEDVEQGPILVPLPLDVSPQQSVPVTAILTEIPPGLYDEIEFEVHKADSNDPADAAFLSSNPSFAGISMTVTGTWDDGSGGDPQPYTYTSDLDEDQERELDPPLTAEGVANNVTFQVDVSRWFRNAAGALIDPRTANKGQPNESIVKDNIKASIEAFEDDDEDGQEDGLNG